VRYIVITTQLTDPRAIDEFIRKVRPEATAMPFFLLGYSRRQSLCRKLLSEPLSKSLDYRRAGATRSTDLPDTTAYIHSGCATPASHVLSAPRACWTAERRRR
jgi:hypothetical protein